MTAAANPWMKFYPQDWRADERLRNCSLAARGLWMEMLAIMHRSERYGHLLIAGTAPTDAQLAIQAGASPDEVPDLIGQLESAGVFSRSAGGAIYSRRMTRDQKKAETARKCGKRGGNPNLCEQRDNSASDKGVDKPSDNGGVKAQKPEARVQKEKKPIVKKDHDLPLDWKPEPFGEGTQSRAIVDAWPPDMFETQVERFRAHHSAKGTKFKDWQHAWSTWVLNSREFSAGRSIPSPGRDTSFLDWKLQQRELDERPAAGGPS